MSLYEEICKIVREKKTKFWNFAGNTYEFTHFYGDRHHYQVKLVYVGKYYDEYLTTTHIVRMSRHNFDYIVRKLMYQIIRNTVRNPEQVKFNEYYARIDGSFKPVHSSAGDFYGWKKV